MSDQDAEADTFSSKKATAIVKSESDNKKQAQNDLKELLKIISTFSGNVCLNRTLIVSRLCYKESQIFVVESCNKFTNDKTFEIKESIDKLKKRLVKRGRKFVSFCVTKKGKQMFNYSNSAAYFYRGGTLLQRRHTDSNTELDNQQRGSSSVTSDNRGAAAIGLRASWKPDNKHPAKRTISNKQFLCCPLRVQLLVKHLDPPNKADNSTFNNQLQLGSDAKDFILKSVQAHTISGKRSQGLNAFAPGKGRGLVIMLYGQPGVSKTLTAESVAQITNKPLLSAGVSDIGTKGNKPSCYYIFLKSRGEGDNDLQRNAMVSDLAIKFKELSREQKANIYISFLEQLNNKSLVKNFTDLKAWATKDSKRYNFNGQQIRNVLSTALRVARTEGRGLRRDDVIEVAEQTDAFKRDLYRQEVIYRDRQITSRT
ncbi:hypothetical protein GGR58DRAFT_518205 [Xylaria digitata]|nr:hypothetical protein GGR58DRAFT_518205 [Xylaria digitata]